MKVLLVTGGAGFIGRHIIKHALSQGWKVKAFDLKPISEIDHQHFDFIVGDVTNLEEVSTSTIGCDAVVHLAALVSVQESMAKPKKTHQINVIGTRNVIQACEQAKITRLIVASSAAVYGSETKMPLSEDQAGACLSPYAESKWKNESQVVSARKRGMDAVALRFFNVYGPNQSTDGPYAAVVTNFIQQMCDGKRPTIYGDGGHSRDFIHASDLAEAILRFLIIPGADISHHVYNVSTGVAHSISSLVEEINQSLRKCNNQHIDISPKFETPREGDILHSEGSILRLKACLDWSPAIPFSNGIEELVKLELKKGS